jgi:hypothetical protein
MGKIADNQKIFCTIFKTNFIKAAFFKKRFAGKTSSERFIER